MRNQNAPSASPAAAKHGRRAKAAEVPAADAAARNGRCVSEEEIRRCAHQKWEAAGNPDGDGVEFWCEAERELGAVR
jgi:hypothetical protein